MAAGNMTRNPTNVAMSPYPRLSLSRRAYVGCSRPDAGSALLLRRSFLGPRRPLRVLSAVPQARGQSPEHILLRLLADTTSAAQRAAQPWLMAVCDIGLLRPV
jgi:hypothetical protein